MGKRKKSTRKPQGPKKNEPLATAFQCLFCNHEMSVTCKLDKKAGTGQLSCKVCGQTFQTSVNALSAPVDIYADWIDACDQVSKDNTTGGPGQPSQTTLKIAPAPTARGGQQEEEYERDFVVNDEAGMDDNYGEE